MLSNEELDKLEQAHLTSANTHLGQEWLTCKYCAIRALIYDLRNTRSRLESHIGKTDGHTV